MRPRTVWVALALVGILFITTAAAQDAAANPPGSTSDDGRWAAGGDLGWIFAIDSGFDGRALLDGFFEYRQTPTVSWRGLLLYTSVNGDRGDVDLLVLNGSVIYQWETTQVRPFFNAGIGAYRYDLPGGGSTIKFGVSFGAGVNIPVASRLDIKLEASLHGTNAPDPDSFAFLTAGVRYRF